MHQLFVIVRGEVEAAVLAVDEVPEQRIGERRRELQVGAAPAGLQQLDQPIEQEGVVVEVRGEARLTVLVDGEQSTVAQQLLADEIHGARRGVCEVGPAEHASRDRHARDRQAVPRREDFLVASRPDARIALRQQDLARFGQAAQHFARIDVELGRDFLLRAIGVQVPLAFEVRRTRPARSAVRKLRRQERARSARTSAASQT